MILSSTAHPLIGIDPEVRGGRPCIAGTHISVRDVMSRLTSGWNVADIKYPIKSKAVVLFWGMHRLPATELTPEQVQQLEHAAGYAPHARQRKRAQAVLSHDRGLSLQQLAQAYATRRDTVRAWLTRFAQGGVAGLAEGARSGRPPKTNQDAQKN